MLLPDQICGRGVGLRNPTPPVKMDRPTLHRRKVNDPHGVVWMLSLGVPFGSFGEVLGGSLTRTNNSETTEVVRTVYDVVWVLNAVQDERIPPTRLVVGDDGPHPVRTTNAIFGCVLCVGSEEMLVLASGTVGMVITVGLAHMDTPHGHRDSETPVKTD